MLLVQTAQPPSQCTNTVAVIKQIAHHLVNLAQHRALAQNASDFLIVGGHSMRELSYPRRIETSRGQGSLQLLRQVAFALGQADLMPWYVQPVVALLQLLLLHQFVDQRAPQGIGDSRCSDASQAPPI